MKYLGEFEVFQLVSINNLHWMIQGKLKNGQNTERYFESNCELFKDELPSVLRPERSASHGIVIEENGKPLCRPFLDVSRSAQSFPETFGLCY